MNDDLTFKSFSKINIDRCENKFFSIDEWSETDWGCALAGEVGELCNLIKKRRRGENISIESIADEIADVFTYLDLTSSKFGINLEQAIIKKFNEVSDRVGSLIKIDERKVG